MRYNSISPMSPPVCPCVAFSGHGWQSYTFGKARLRVGALYSGLREAHDNGFRGVNHGHENDAG